METENFELKIFQNEKERCGQILGQNIGQKVFGQRCMIKIFVIKNFGDKDVG